MVLKCQLIKKGLVIFEDNQFMSKHTFHIQEILQYICFNWTYYTYLYVKWI